MSCLCGEHLACVWSHSFKEKDCPELQKKTLKIEVSNDFKTPKPKACQCGEHLGCVWTKHAYAEADCPELKKKQAS
jgi:hypothetical protein